jgi:hypothetical protein
LKRFVLTLLVLTCTSVYATNGGSSNNNNNNNVSGTNNIVDSVVNNNTGSTTNNYTPNSGNTNSAAGGKANATGTAISGSVSHGGTGGTSNSTSSGGTSNSTSSGGISSAKGGDSAATGGKVDSNIASYINVGCTENCGANSTDKQIAEDRIAADKEIAAGNNKAQIDSANARIKNTPSMFSPPLVSSNDTCMGSTSGSVAAPGLGIGFGTAWVDDNCKMLKNSQALWNMGFKAASIALMCNDDKIKEALEITGYTCPVKENKSTSVVTSKPYEQ